MILSHYQIGGFVSFLRPEARYDSHLKLAVLSCSRHMYSLILQGLKAFSRWLGILSLQECSHYPSSRKKYTGVKEKNARLLVAVVL